MSLENEYLSDQELEVLILEIEQNDMVMAPPELLSKIVSGVESIEKEETDKLVLIQRKKDVRKEYVQYCFRVCASVAAAIAMIFIMPKFAYAKTAEIPTKQEVLANEKYATREEVLDETNFLMKLLGNIEFFNKNREISILNEEIGGK